MSVHVGDIGSEIIYDVGEDISAGSGLKLKYRKPDGSVGQWTAVLHGTTAVKYVTTAVGDLPLAGAWDFQPYIELSGWKGHGVKKTAEILPIIVVAP
jgi:hypothetical protein